MTLINLSHWQVVGVSLVLVAQDFHPEKYQVLSRALLDRYLATGNPALLLDAYLGVFTKGICPTTDNDNGMAVNEYDTRHAYAASPIRGKY